MNRIQLVHNLSTTRLRPNSELFLIHENSQLVNFGSNNRFKNAKKRIHRQLKRHVKKT